VASRAPIAALVEEGRVRSICYAATGPAPAVEAGVDTVEDARGRGFAPRVVAAWAAEMHRARRIPFYSTSWSNTASRAVARKLGLVQFGTDWHLR
jgi:predicted GNAT family acetyltransferase